MRAVCPKNKRHKLFITTAHVMEEWVVDAQGSFVRRLACLQVDRGPDKDNNWTCRTCGAEAVVTED